VHCGAEVPALPLSHQLNQPKKLTQLEANGGFYTGPTKKRIKTALEKGMLLTTGT
jgi:hypothetical protein